MLCVCIPLGFNAPSLSERLKTKCYSDELIALYFVLRVDESELLQVDESLNMCFALKLKDDHSRIQCYTCMLHSVLSTPLISNKIAGLALNHCNKKVGAVWDVQLFQGCDLLLQSKWRIFGAFDVRDDTVTPPIGLGLLLVWMYQSIVFVIKFLLNKNSPSK